MNQDVVASPRHLLGLCTPETVRLGRPFRDGKCFCKSVEQLRDACILPQSCAGVRPIEIPIVKMEKLRNREVKPLLKVTSE